MGAKLFQNSNITIFECKIVNNFFPIRFNLCFGCSKEPSQWASLLRSKNINFGLYSILISWGLIQHSIPFFENYVDPDQLSADQALNFFHPNYEWNFIAAEFHYVTFNKFSVMLSYHIVPWQASNIFLPVYIMSHWISSVTDKLPCLNQW